MKKVILSLIALSYVMLQTEMLAAQDVQVVGRDAQLAGIFCHLMLLAEMTLNQLPVLRQHLGQRLHITGGTARSAQFGQQQEYFPIN